VADSLPSDNPRAASRVTVDETFEEMGSPSSLCWIPKRPQRSRDNGAEQGQFPHLHQQAGLDDSLVDFPAFSEFQFFGGFFLLALWTGYLPSVRRGVLHSTYGTSSNI
jgi:hypothetical protein